jgi:hypothetical protein
MAELNLKVRHPKKKAEINLKPKLAKVPKIQIKALPPSPPPDALNGLFACTNCGDTDYPDLHRFRFCQCQSVKAVSKSFRPFASAR